MRIDGFTQGPAINLSDLAGILDKVNVGDVVRAQILEISSGEALLKLFDGSTVQAKVPGGLDGKVGEFLDLAVKSKDGSQVVLETVKNNSGKIASEDQLLKSQLLEIGVKPDEKSLNIAKEMKTNQLPVNREVFDTLVDTVSKFKALTPAKAAFLMAENMGIEEKNISALNQLVDGKAQISSELGKLSDTLKNIQDPELLKKIETILTTPLSTGTPMKSTESSVQNSQDMGIEAQLKSGSTPDELQVRTGISEKLSDTVMSLIKQAQGNEGKLPIPASVLQQKVSEFIRSNGLEGDLPEKLTAFLKNDPDLKQTLLAQDGNTLKKAVEEVFGKLKQEWINPMEGKSVDPHNRAADPHQHLRENIEKAFKALSVDIQSDTLKDDLKVKDLYKEIYTKLEGVKDTLEGSQLPNRQDITSNIDQMQNNMRFMNELANHSTYVQIPLKLWDQNTTGEVYVLKRDSKKKKIDPENATVFISLNTENLGQVDSLIGVTKKNITVNLRLEDQEIIDFVKGSYKELYNRLNEKGFKLVDMKYRLREEETNVLNVQDNVRKETQAGRTSIDYRL